MLIRIKLAELRQTKVTEILVRFVLGGGVTVMTGLIAQHYGSAVGGLFLAFPTIFPASATLIERHEREKKRRAGIAETTRGRLSAAIDARGAALGSIALVGFASIIWKGLSDAGAPTVLGIAVFVWLALATLLWLLRRAHARWRAFRNA
jgi:hypothetical protein